MSLFVGHTTVLMEKPVSGEDGTCLMQLYETNEGHLTCPPASSKRHPENLLLIIGYRFHEIDTSSSAGFVL